MGKNAPSPPDPYQSAQAQYQYGTEAAAYNKALNAPNTYGPTGQTTSQVTGYSPTGAPIYSETTTLTPQEQALLSGEQAGSLAEENLGRSYLGNAPTGPFMGTPNAPTLETNLDTSNVPQLPGGAQLAALGQGAQSQALAGEEAAIQPGMAQEKESLQAQLINSGNGPGTPAYESAMAQEDARQNAAQTQAAGAAIQAGTGIEQTRYGEAATSNAQQYQEDLQTMTAQNQAQGMSEQDAIAAAQAQLAERGGIAQAGAGLVSAGAPSIPSAAGLPSASTATPDIMSAIQNAYQGQLAGYNAKVGTENSLIGDASMLAALAMMT